MKKLLTLVAFAILLDFGAQAQFVRYGARLGNGVAYVSDDLLTRSPIFGFNLGGYVDYMFLDWKNPWAENIYLQTGLNFTRRGTNYQQVFVNMQSIRQGFIHDWYAQIPILAGFKYEIPQLPAGNFVSIYIGPTVNVGIFGRLWERQVTPGMPQRTSNYDTYITGNKDDRNAFKHQRRVDVGVLFGVGYQWHNFTFDVHLDHGFIAIMKKDDVLNGVLSSDDEDATPQDRNAYTGINQAIMFSVGYQLPINR